MNISDIISKRHAVKSFDPDRKIGPEEAEQLEKLLRFSPSSVNLQPWHYVVASSEKGKELVAESASGDYSYNRDKITDCSHVVVFCCKTSLEDSYLEKLLDREEADGRLKDQKARELQHGVKFRFSDLHRKDLKDSWEWMKNQVYLSAGFFLNGLSLLGLDSCPMEGFDSIHLDKALGIEKTGYTTVLLVAVGYRDSGDFNAELPKSRLPEDAVISRI